MGKRSGSDNLVFLIFIVICSAFFLILTTISIYLDFFNQIDTLILNYISHFREPWLDSLMVFLSSLISYYSIFILSLFLIIIFIYKKKYRFILIYLASIFFGYLSKNALKFLIQRERPIFSLIAEQGYAFPSGHATLALIIFALLIYFFSDSLNDSGLKKLFLISSILLILLIGFSRIYLGVHWFTDVIGGYFLGITCVGLILLIFKK